MSFYRRLEITDEYIAVISHSYRFNEDSDIVRYTRKDIGSLIYREHMNIFDKDVLLTGADYVIDRVKRYFNNHPESETNDQVVHAVVRQAAHYIAERIENKDEEVIIIPCEFHKIAWTYQNLKDYIVRSGILDSNDFRIYYAIDTIIAHVKPGKEDTVEKIAGEIAKISNKIRESVT